MPFQIMISTHSQRLRFTARILVKALVLNVSCLVFLFTSSALAQVTVTAMPTFSPMAGTYSSAQTVTISTTTSSATIYYTTNGTTPTTNSTVYSGPLTVSSTETVEAIAIANGLSNSAVGSSAYTIGSVTAPSCSAMSLGNGASLNGFVPFPSTNVWNTNIVSAPVDPNSSAIVAASGFAGWYLHPDFGNDSGDGGIPYVVVDSTTTPTVSINVIDYASQSDVVVAPYPITAPIEGNPADCSGWPDTYNGDAHVLVLDRAKCELYETYNTNRCNGHWDASSETIWDMHNYESRPFGWTSADAAGLSVFSGLVRYDEIASGAINHALRFTLEQTKNDANNGYFVPPATHAAGNNWGTNNVIGMRIRLKASFDISGFSPVNQIILTAMQQYGLILAENGGNFYFHGASDPRFDDNDLANLEQIASSNFEVVQAAPEFPGYDSAAAPTGAAPTINSFSASASSVSAGNPFTITYSASGDSYDYIDMIGPVSGGSVTITPTETNTYTLFSTNAYGRSVSTPITVTVPGSAVAAPTFTPVAGTYSSTQTVTINTPTSPSAAIYYTTDGTTPTTSSTEYSGPITVSATQTVKAIATVTGYSAPSAVGSAAYTLGSSDTVGSLVKAKPAATPAVTQAPSLVNQVASGSGTTSAVSGTGANFIAICTMNSGIAPTDSSSNIYTLVKTVPISGFTGVSLWSVSNPTVTSSMTFSASSIYGNATGLVAQLFSGIASGPDQTNSADSQASGNITPTNNNELILGCSGVQSASPSTGVTSPLTFSGDAGAAIFGAAAAYQIQTTSTAVGATFTGSAGGANTTLIASFYSAETPATLAVTTTAVPEGFVSTTYNGSQSTYSPQLTATGGVLPYTWSCPSTCHLPAGLILSSGGLITGTPTTAGGPTNVTFKVTDSHSPTASTATVTLPMTIAATAFSLGAGTCTGSVLIGTQYVAFGGCALSGSGGTSPLTYSYNNTPGAYGNWASIPPGLVLNSSTGALTGTNYGQGGYEVQFIATDSLGTQAAQTVTFALNGNNTLGGCSLFPSDSAFHINVSGLPVDTSPAAPMGYSSAHLSVQFAAYVGPGTGEYQPNGIPIFTVPYNQTLVAVTNNLYTNATAFTEGPLPWYTPLEGSQNASSSNPNGYVGDGHISIVQTAGGGNPCQLWEMWTSQFDGTAYTSGPWSDSSNAHWANIGSTGTGAYAMPAPDGGSSDAAGLPLAPLLVNADEVIGTGTPSAPNGSVLHPIRFTLQNALNYDVWPATTHVGLGLCSGGYEDGNHLILQPGSAGGNQPTSCTDTSPMGEIYRLKASVTTPSCASTSPQSAIIIQGLRNYGIILADVGISGGLIGTPDARWSDSDLTCLTQLTLSNFEPVNVQSVIKTLDGSNLPTVSYQTMSSTSTSVAATPTFSPAAGTYSSAQPVAIGTATPSATIYYTTNGSTPTTSSQVYSGPITVSTSETVEAIAVASGYSTSAAGSAAYTINLTQAASPSFSPAAGTYSSAQTVTIATTTPSATIYYTTDGSTPTTSSAVYSGPITVSSTETLQAIAVVSGYSTSAVGKAAYTINLPAAAPTFSPAAGTYSSAQTVAIGTATPSATIYYTTNGSTPTTSSQVYSGPITVSATETVEAIAVASGYSTSATGSAAYTINLPAATPTFSPAAGTYSSAQTVTIGTATPSATIYYTTNGSTPTTGSAVYSGPITVSSTETVEAIAAATGYSTSSAGSATYTINLTQAATPTFSPVAGTYSSAQTVMIGTTTPSATIYYTTNGSTPTTSSAVYSGPITVSSTETLQAIAVASGYSTSAAGSAAYTITSAAATPAFSPAAGTYSSAQTVTIGTATPSATIYYTTNGSTPTASSAVYSGPLTVSSPLRHLEAIAVASGYSTSAAGSAAYTITSAAATPTFSPAAGTYSSAQTVTIGTATPSATIYYTTNGSTPTTSSQVYSGPITVSSTETLKAIAVATGYSTSSAGSAAYTITTAATTPTFSPAAGTYSSAQTVTIGTATPSATIYYTTNGSTPTASSASVFGPAHCVFATETLQAIAVASGYSTSATGSAAYTINLTQAATPTFSPAAGTYNSSQTVTIGTATPSATIYYTTNGSTPTASSAVYSGPLTVSATETLQAIAVASGYSTSAAGSAAYTITSAAATPSFSPAAGTYSSAQTVTIGTTTPSATIYYTTNGSTPTASSAVYSGPLTVSSPLRPLEAIAVASWLFDQCDGLGSLHHQPDASGYADLQPCGRHLQLCADGDDRHGDTFSDDLLHDQWIHAHGQLSGVFGPAHCVRH
jgi:hypothetical protein